MKKLLLGIDIGTSACKVVVFDYSGDVLAQSTKPYNIYYPMQGWVEQDPMEWWKCVCCAVKECLAAGKVDPAHIAGIGIAGQSWSAIPIDKKGNVLCNTPIWMDTRASDISARILQKLGFDRIFRVSGNSFEPTYTTPKILWFKEHRPEIFNKTHKFLQSNSFIAYKLTGSITQDVSQGYGLHVFDMKTARYDEKLCGEMGIPGEMLPDIFACHEVIGQVTKEAADETGLKEGTPVVAGGLDAACGTLGAGVVNIGETQEQGGQAGGMSICVGEATAHPKLILGFHVVPGLWLLQGGTVGGGSLKWFREQLGTYEESQEKQTGISAYKIMDEEASSVNPGSDGLIFLPYMAGERSPLWDRNAMGVFFGLEYTKTRAHMIRAIMEGCAYALNHNIETAEEVGVKVDTLNAMGGAANSMLWTQIKSDVTGKIIKVPSSDTATTLGAAILAGIGTGVYEDFGKAVASTIKIKRIHEPDMNNHKIYTEYGEIYLEIYKQLKDTMARCNNIKLSQTSL